MKRSQRFRRDQTRSSERNLARVVAANPMAIPTLDRAGVTTLSQGRTRQGFNGEIGGSYLVRTGPGSSLCDVSFGDEGGAISHNASRLGVTRTTSTRSPSRSHLHNDHMGDSAASYPSTCGVKDMDIPCGMSTDRKSAGEKETRRTRHSRPCRQNALRPGGRRVRFERLAPGTGLEPMTSWSTAKRSNQAELPRQVRADGSHGDRGCQLN